MSLGSEKFWLQSPKYFGWESKFLGFWFKLFLTITRVWSYFGPKSKFFWLSIKIILIDKPDKKRMWTKKKNLGPGSKFFWSMSYLDLRPICQTVYWSKIVIFLIIMFTVKALGATLIKLANLPSLCWVRHYTLLE